MGTQERTNERANEQTDGRTQPARCSSLFVALSAGRRSFAHSLALRRFCIFIDCHLTSPTTADRGLRQFPHPSRSSFSSSQPHSAAASRYEEPPSLFLALFPHYHAYACAPSSSPALLPCLPATHSLFLLTISIPLSLVRSSTHSLRPASFEASFASSVFPSLALSWSPSLFHPLPRAVLPLSSSLSFSLLPTLRSPVMLLPPTLDTNSLDAAEFSFEATIRGSRYISTAIRRRAASSS